MVISSRTPEGQPGSCPLCGANVVINPSIIIGDATCPRCGQLLWFAQTGEMTIVFEQDSSSDSKRRAINIIAKRLGVTDEQILNNPHLSREVGVDSLDTVELMMELEDDFDHS